MSRFDLAQLDAEVGLHVAAARKALVQVHAGRNGAGSGVLLHGDGLIITNAHVVRRGQARVTLADGQEVSARLLAYDEGVDLAALAVDVPPNGGQRLATLSLGDSRLLKPGSIVIAVGHPWGVVGAATAGMVIGVGPPLEPLPYAGDLIQVGLHLRPGHSGGPMLNAAGELIGINTMIAGPLVGLAIPSHTVRTFLKDNLGSERRRRRAERTPPVLA